MSAFHVRPARAGDLDRLLAIHVAAFPDDRGVDVRRRNFERNPLGGFDRLRVLETAGVVVAHAFLFSLDAFFGGRPVPTAAIASVGIAPEARGRGIASQLLAELEREARARGDVIAMLHPYRQGFYRRLGYAPVTPSSWIHTSPRAVPAAWVERARTLPIDALRAPAGPDVPAIEACYLRAARRSTGLLARTSALWEKQRCDERRHVLALAATGGEGGEPLVRGYVAFEHEQREAHADVTLRVHELVADDDEARRVLLGALGAQRDQVRTLLWRAPQGDPLVLALEDADRDRDGTEHVEHALGTIVAGPMVKILDRHRALGARGYLADGDPTFDVRGAQPETLRLTVARGAGRAAAVDPAIDRASRVTFTEPALASMLFGGVRARDAARLGWVDGTPAALEALDAVFGAAPFEVVDPF
jgi:predicted acetyltransferase